MNNTMDRPIERPWWKRPRGIAIGVVVACTALVAMATSMVDSQRKLRLPAERATFATVEQGVFHDFVPLRGQVVPRDVVFINSRAGGRVERILVQAGDMVEKDQPIIELSNPDLQREVTTTELSLIEQINNLRNTEVTMEDARVSSEQQLADMDYNLATLKRQADRQEYYFSKGVTSAEERDKAVDALAHATQLRAITFERNKRQEELRKMRAPELQKSLALAQSNLVDTRAKLSYLTVRSPVSGRLSNIVDYKIGQNCAAAEHVGDVTLDTGFNLSAEIDEYYLTRVRAGLKAKVDIEDAEFSLTVIRVHPQVKEGRFIIDLDFESDAPKNLLAGQTLQGKLLLGDDLPALTVPAGAFLEQTGGKWIFVVSAEDNSAYRRAIKIGRRNSEQVEVLEGLRSGEKVIISEYRGFDRIDRIQLTGRMP